MPLADVKARLSAVLDEVRSTHDRVLITRNGRPEAVIIAVSDLEALEETLDLLCTAGAMEQIRQAEADITAGEAIDADELRRQLATRASDSGVADEAPMSSRSYASTTAPMSTTRSSDQGG